MSRLFVLLVLAAAACESSASSPDAAPIDSTGVDADVAVVPPPYRCDLAECEGGFARTCDQEPMTLDCSSFGAACAPQTDFESGEPFRWCSCGTVDEGDGFCLGGRYGVTCFDGLGGLSDCGTGYSCVARPNGPFGIGCECNNLPDGICPGTSCSSDPDCATCTPSCTNKQCGDNGCGGECGTCDFGDTCGANGRCEEICVPDCIDKQCGDDGCGGTCGTCAAGETCSGSGTCSGPCVPDCDGQTCGSDGCGGSCGSCAAGFECNTEGACDCPFFGDPLEYSFAMAPQSQFPANFSFVALNVKHINLDGSEGTPNGAGMGFAGNFVSTFTHRVRGCKPKIQIKRDYALSGKSCTITETIEGRTSFVIPAPTMFLPNGNCVAPPL
jgi:hypothetical protein